MIFSEIVIVGREILQGKVLDTNSNWLANELKKLGIRVKRILIVDDVKEEIAEAVHSIIRRKPRLAFFTGGLGPTFDDMTAESVAYALNLDLIEDELAIKYIAEICEKKSLPLTKERRKMAMIPRGARALKNNVGMAPGIHLNFQGIDFFLLPGVPSEMKDIFTNEIIPILKTLEGREYYDEIHIEIRGIPEADLAGVLKKYKDAFEPVYIKSHPRKDERGFYIMLHLSIFTEKKEELNMLEEVKDGIINELKSLAFSIIIYKESK